MHRFSILIFPLLVACGGAPAAQSTPAPVIGEAVTSPPVEVTVAITTVPEPTVTAIPTEAPAPTAPPEPTATVEPTKAPDLTASPGLSEEARALSTVAQADRCFPETGQCISGRFRQYWEQNGGLAVFGYPITPAQDEVNADTGQTYLTQWFERNRFELHTDTAAPYDVQLGRLGDARLKQQGRDWFTFPKGQQMAGCLWFPETGHSVCEPFRSYWETHGLLDPALNAYARSLALFGLPLSERTMETNASGDAVETQWFERARFECHPNNPPEFRVLLGLLGNEVRQNPAIPGAKPAVTCSATAPSPPPAPAPTATQQPVPQPTATQRPAPSCDPAYPDVCIPSPPPMLSCDEVEFRDFVVLPPDPHGFDRNQNGRGCESEPDS